MLKLICRRLIKLAELSLHNASRLGHFQTDLRKLKDMDKEKTDECDHSRGGLV